MTQIPDFKNTHLFDRLSWAKQNLKRVESQYAVVWEDAIDEACKVTIPAPEWMACALAGGILPPIEAYLMDKTTPDGSPKLHPYAAPIGPMTEEEAIEYMIKQCIPNHVWEATGGNSIRLVICTRDQISKDRTFRNAQRIIQDKEKTDVAA